LSFFAVLAMKKSRAPPWLPVYRASNMTQEAAGEVMNYQDAAVAVAEVSVVAGDIESAPAAYLPFYIGDTVTDLVRMLVVVAPSAALGAPFEVLVFPEKHPVQCIHNFLSHHRWHWGFASVKEEWSLT